MAGLWEKEFANLLGGAVVSTRKQVQRKIVRIQRELNEINERFWKLFAARTIGAEGTPAYASDEGAKWEPLNAKYAKSKGHSRFYEKSGKLGAYIRGLSYKGTFGAPRVVPKFEVRGTEDGEETEFFRGNKLVRSFRSVTTGRFIRQRDIKEFIPVGIKIIEYPNLRNGRSDPNAGNIEEALFGAGSAAAYKFQNPKMKRLRPAVGPYLKWWSRNVVRGVLSKYGKVT